MEPNNSPSKPDSRDPLLQLLQVQEFKKTLRNEENAVKCGIDDMISFQRHPIPTSLLKINDKLKSRAVRLFRLILTVMGLDDPNQLPKSDTKIDAESVQKLLEEASKWDELKDELFAQIWKQTRNNPDKSSLVKAWKLFSMCAPVIRPGIDMASHLARYLHNTATDPNSDEQIKKMAFATSESLKRCLEIGPRIHLPSQEEIEAYVSDKMLTTAAFFMDESMQLFEYDLKTTARDAYVEIAQKIGLEYYESFGLFKGLRRSVAHLGSRDIEHDIAIDENKYIGDVLTDFSSSRDRRWDLRLVFKRRWFDESQDLARNRVLQQLCYFQVRNDFRLGKYPVATSSASRLVALQILSELGSDKRQNIEMANTDQWTAILHACLPKIIHEKNNNKKWAANVFAYIESMPNFTKKSAMQEFLDLLKLLPQGHSVFFVLGSKTLAINCRGIHFLKSRKKRYLCSVEMKEIESFCTTADKCVLIRIAVDGVPFALEIVTKHAKEICSVLENLRKSENEIAVVKSEDGHSSPEKLVFKKSLKILKELGCKKLSQSEGNAPSVGRKRKIGAEERPRKTITDNKNMGKKSPERQMHKSKSRNILPNSPEKQTHQSKSRNILPKAQSVRKRHLKGTIRVYCRWRPLNQSEMSGRQECVLTAVGDHSLEHPGDDGKRKEHTLDSVFDDKATQEKVFDKTKFLIHRAIEGYNVCIFSYGKTGSGKSFTLYGTDECPGILPRTATEVFRLLENQLDRKTSSFLVKVYMAELYQDKLTDLLFSPTSGKLPPDLRIRKDSKGRVTVENVTILPISNAQQLEKVLEQKDRRTSPISHLIFSIIIEVTSLETQVFSVGKITVIDVAGSDMASLSAVGDVISSLANKRGENKPDIPYANHKLTMLLSDAIGGNARTLLFLHISPVESNMKEIHESLQLVHQARSIANKPTKTVISKEVAKLKNEIAEWKARAGIKEKES